ncbi:fatty acid desaturase family protein [Thermoleptolyngbya sp.]
MGSSPETLATSRTEVAIASLGSPSPSARQILSTTELAALNQRSTPKGLWQLGSHLAIMGMSGALWATQMQNLWVALPALVVYGFSLASMFAAMHESVHRTAFASNRLNDAVGWLAGLLSFYNSTFYRRYHKWHHRYTQIPGKDPELSDPKPQTLRDYWVELSAIPWWIGKVKTHLKIASGNVQDYPFLPKSAYAEVIRSTWVQLAVYAGAIATSILLGHPAAFFLYWVLPLAVGQPILRAILLAEHTGCTNDDNPFTNTRTTLTRFPIRLLMWNMPFHTEHHLYPSIPFHALPAAYEHLSEQWQHVERGYLRVNQGIISTLKPAVK